VSNRITTDQLAELHAQDKAGRVTRELLQAFLRDPSGWKEKKCETGFNASILTMEDIGPEKRSFEACAFLLDGETSVIGHTMIERTAGMSGKACGQDDGQYLLDNQQDIPSEFRKFYLVVQDWRHPDGSDDVCYLYWGGYSRQWFRDWDWLGGGDWSGDGRVLRRK